MEIVGRADYIFALKYSYLIILGSCVLSVIVWYNRFTHYLCENCPNMIVPQLKRPVPFDWGRNYCVVFRRATNIACVPSIPLLDSESTDTNAKLVESAFEKGNISKPPSFLTHSFVLRAG